MLSANESSVQHCDDCTVRRACAGSDSQIMPGEAKDRRVFAMEIRPAYVDVAVERWPSEAGKESILDGEGKPFSQVNAGRLK
jgi:hypothetical protein